MTIIDHKGRNSRIYRAEEALFDDITLAQYMDHLVDQTVLILTNEPADIYANPTFLPDTMAHDYDKYGTDGRIERVLNVLQQQMCIRDSNSGVIILAATNRVDVLDKALLRAGCFDRQIHVDLSLIHI